MDKNRTADLVHLELLNKGLATTTPILLQVEWKLCSMFKSGEECDWQWTERERGGNGVYKKQKDWNKIWCRKEKGS